jgi:hypothetical protein
MPFHDGNWVHEQHCREYRYGSAPKQRQASVLPHRRTNERGGKRRCRQGDPW